MFANERSFEDNQRRKSEGLRNAEASARGRATSSRICCNRLLLFHSGTLTQEVFDFFD